VTNETLVCMGRPPLLGYAASYLIMVVIIMTITVSSRTESCPSCRPEWYLRHLQAEPEAGIFLYNTREKMWNVILLPDGLVIYMLACTRWHDRDDRTLPHHYRMDFSHSSRYVTLQT
jgi:hypothetical protein